MVDQPIEQSAGQACGAESFGPFVKWQVAGDHRGAALIALRDHLEQKLGVDLGQRHEAQLVDDQQFDAGQLLLQARQAAFLAGLHQLVDQRGGGGEAERDGPRLLRRGQRGVTHGQRPDRIPRLLEWPAVTHPRSSEFE